VTWLGQVADWIAAHETFLSGLAALVAVVTVVVTPIGLAVKRGRLGGEAASASPAYHQVRTASPRAARASLAATTRASATR